MEAVNDKIGDNKMCFSSPKPPSVSAPPPPAPPPTVTPSNVSEISAQETARKQRIAQLRYGFTSTIKNQGGASGVLQPTETGLKKQLG